MPNDMQQANTAGAVDAVALLIKDHEKAKKAFEEFEKSKDKMGDEEKLALVKQVCADLMIHMEIEEKVFYPSVGERIDDEDMMNEAKVEHSSAKDLIAQLGKLKPDDPMFDAKFAVLGEQIEHHVDEEEKEMFPQARQKGADMAALGKRLQSARMKAREAHGLPPEEA
jgi:hemerythrin superfamily protein